MKYWTGWSREHHRVRSDLRRQTPAEMRQMLAKGAGNFCRRNLSAWRWCMRQPSTGLGRSFVTRPSDAATMPDLFLPSDVPAECVCAHTWTSWSVAAFPGQSSLCPWSASAFGNTWVARVGFPGISIEWGWAGASEGENQKGSSCTTWSWASVCRGLDHQRSWCRGPSVARSGKGVLFGRRAEDGRQRWNSRGAMGAVCANRRASEYRSNLDTRRSFGRFRRFPEPLRLIPDSHCCFVFSLSSLLECCPEFCREGLVGQRLTIFTALNSRSVASHCGLSCGHGRKALSVGLLWMLQTVSPLMPHTSYQWSGQLCLQWVIRRPLLLFLAGRMCWPTRTANIWEMGTSTSWWSIPSLICVFWSDVCRRSPLPFLGLWIPSLWRNLLSRVWRVQSSATGWCPVPVFAVPSSPGSCQCRCLLRSSAVSWECGLSSWSTSKRLVERLTATA